MLRYSTGEEEEEKEEEEEQSLAMTLNESIKLQHTVYREGLIENKG